MHLLKHLFGFIVFGAIAFGAWMLLPGEAEIPFLWWLVICLGAGVASFIAYTVGKVLERLWARRP